MKTPTPLVGKRVSSARFDAGLNDSDAVSQDQVLRESVTPHAFLAKSTATVDGFSTGLPYASKDLLAHGCITGS